MFFEGVGGSSSDFWCPGDGLEKSFSWLLGSKHPQISGPSGLVENGWRLGASNKHPGSLKPDFRDPETETGKLETEKRVHRIHGTLETGLQKDASQPGGPHKGGRRISCPRCRV